MQISIKKRYKRFERLSWIARIASILSMAVLLVFLFGEEFDTSKITPAQWLGFLFFPVGLSAGFVIGWKNELIGGTVSLLSLLAFYLVYGVLVTKRLPRGFAFLVFSIPAFLFLICGIYGQLALKVFEDKDLKPGKPDGE